MKNLSDYLTEALVDEAISIPRKFNTAFTYDDLSLEQEEMDFMMKYLKTDKVYQLPEFDENENEIKQFSKMYNLIKKSKKLEEFEIDRSTYTAYEFPKGTIAIYFEGGYNGGCFYLSSNKIDE